MMAGRTWPTLSAELRSLTNTPASVPYDKRVDYPDGAESSQGWGLLNCPICGVSMGRACTCLAQCVFYRWDKNGPPWWPPALFSRLSHLAGVHMPRVAVHRY